MVAILGAGISGLSVAYFLRKLGIESVILEKESSPGGIIGTRNINGALLEEGPNSLLLDPFLNQLIEELGISDQKVGASAANKNRYILKLGKYQKLPASPLELMTSNFFSIGTRYKIVSELFRKPAASGHRFLYDLFADHFGNEVADYALVPFISGIYAGNPKELLVSETFPSLLLFEKTNGSILKSLARNTGERKTTTTFRNGIQTLPASMAALVDIKYNSHVTSIKKSESEYVVEYVTQNERNYLTAKLVILCLPASSISLTVRNIYPKLAMATDKIKYPPMTLVYTSYKQHQVGKRKSGFGGLHPKVENQFSAGSIWTSELFEGRCHNDEVLYTTFVGGSLYESNALLPFEIIAKNVHQELKSQFKISGEPQWQESKHWPRSIPQYNNDVLPLKALAQDLEKDNLYICSNMLGGVSVGDCIKKGHDLAHRIAITAPGT